MNAQAFAEEPTIIDDTENDAYKIPRGWVNSIDDDSIIIDDTYYIFTSETQFQSHKGQLQEGEFVEFKLGADNIVATIKLAEPADVDLDMKPEVSDKKNSTPKSDGNKSGPTLKDGVWIN
jgi:hypothetical protein